MKFLTTFVGLAASGILVASLAGQPAASQGTAARIREASSIFVGPADPAVTPARIRTSLLALIDVTSSVCPDSQYQAEIRNRIGVARELIEKDSLFNDKARQYLSLAYRMMTNGKKYERPKELEEFVTPMEANQKARTHGRRLVEVAVGALEAGHPGETARLLLELVLMIVTPIEG